MTQGAVRDAAGLLSTRDVAVEVGVSYRMLDYWARCSALLAPTVNANGSGSARGYSEEDVERLRKAACLVRALGEHGGHGGNTITVEFIERFVREAIETLGGWIWSTTGFCLSVRCT